MWERTVTPTIFRTQPPCRTHSWRSAGAEAQLSRAGRRAGRRAGPANVEAQASGEACMHIGEPACASANGILECIRARSATWCPDGPLASRSAFARAHNPLAVSKHTAGFAPLTAACGGVGFLGSDTGADNSIFLQNGLHIHTAVCRPPSPGSGLLSHIHLQVPDEVCVVLPVCQPSIHRVRGHATPITSA